MLHFKSLTRLRLAFAPLCFDFPRAITQNPICGEDDKAAGRCKDRFCPPPPFLDLAERSALPLRDLVAEEHADDGDQDVVGDGADDERTDPRANRHPVDGFVAARPRPKTSGGVVVADHDRDVGQERGNDDRQQDNRDDDNDRDQPSREMKPPVALELSGGRLGGIGGLMPLQRDLQSEPLPVGAVLDALRPDGHDPAQDQ